mmetsp:Transcript_11068/g.41288  ORF Transcript_11068/g.41288 Transcript_11068/m.41288 type:complete len:103 (-) Transcript_11068:439-747(-)
MTNRMIPRKASAVCGWWSPNLTAVEHMTAVEQTMAALAVAVAVAVENKLAVAVRMQGMEHLLAFVAEVGFQFRWRLEQLYQPAQSQPNTRSRLGHTTPTKRW